MIVLTKVIFWTFVAATPHVVEMTVRNEHRGAVSFAPIYAHRLEKRSGDSTVVPLSLNNSKSYYTAEVSVGTPPQLLRLLLDTGSSDLWILAKENPYCEPPNGTSISENDEPESGFQKRRTVPLEPFIKQLEVERSAAHPYLDQIEASVEKVRVSPDGKIDCSNSGVFDYKASATWGFNETSEDFSIRYGDYTFAKGRWGTDVLTVGNLTINSPSIGLGERANSSQGVFGIGLPGVESTVIKHHGSMNYSYENFPMLLKRNGLTKSITYSLWLNDPSAKEGTILFGGVDHSKYIGELQTVPLVDRYNRSHVSELTVVLNELKVTDHLNKSSAFLVNSSLPVLLDSGTSFTYLPTKLVEALMESFHTGFIDDIGFHILPCSVGESNVTFTYSFSGVNIKVPLRQMLVPLTAQGGIPAMLNKGRGQACAFAILPTRSHRIILGDNFLRSAYVVFDLENLEVSMANAVSNITRSSVQPIIRSIPCAKKAPLYEEGFRVSYDFEVLEARNVSLAKHGSSDFTDLRVVEDAPDEDNPPAETVTQSASARLWPRLGLLWTLATLTLIY